MELTPLTRPYTLTNMTTTRKKFTMSTTDPNKIGALRDALNCLDKAVNGVSPWDKSGDVEIWSDHVEFWINRLTD